MQASSKLYLFLILMLDVVGDFVGGDESEDAKKANVDWR